MNIQYWGSMKKTVLCALLCVLLSASGLAAQTAGEMDKVLNAPAVSYSQAALFVLTAANIAPETGSPFDMARELRWLPVRAEAEAPIPLGELSLLIMKSFEFSGGLMFSLFPIPRYACRELVSKEIIQGSADPSRRLDGTTFFQIMGRVLLFIGEDEEMAAAARMPEEERQRQEAARQARLDRLELERQRIAADINRQLEAMQVRDTRAQASASGITISLTNINFQADSSELDAAERRKISDIGEILKKMPGRKILVAGHTAQAGTRQGQIEIATRRAQAVADYLIQLGVRRRNEITVQGFGAERPVADPSTPEGMRMNRRVEIIILER